MPKQIYLALAVLLALMPACAQSTTTDTTGAAPTRTPIIEGGMVIKGFGISPRGFPLDYGRFGEFLEEVDSLPNSGVMFNGAWRDDIEGGTDSGEAPNTAIEVMQQAAKFGFTPIIVFGWRSDGESLHLSLPANLTDDWTNEDAKALFEQMLVDFASAYQPPYLFLGNESDGYYITNAGDYARWVEVYNRAYDAVKAVSPETEIGPIFQYERLSGQGHLNNWATPYWGALEEHDLGRVDLIGLTFYPWLGYATPEEIPDDYLAPLLDRIDGLPIAITETGWPAEELGLETSWEKTPEAQVRYIIALDRVLQGVDLRILNWLYLHPMTPLEHGPLFWQLYGSLSLRDADGDKRPVYDAWVEFQP